jgi:hypothetical protein
MGKRYVWLVAGSLVLSVWFLSAARLQAGAKKTRELVSKMAMPIDLDKGIDKDTPLRDALEFLSDRYDITMIIDGQAFKDDLEETKIASKPVLLPKMKAVAFGTVLRLLLDQVGGTALIRSDYIEIVPTVRVVREIYQGREGPRFPLVHAAFEGTPLDEALERLTAATGVSVVVDPRTERGKETVNALLVNVPLDSAVRVLADSAGLKMVRLDNVLYLTGPESARALQAELERHKLPAPAKDGKEQGTKAKLQAVPREAAK